MEQDSRHMTPYGAFETTSMRVLVMLWTKLNSYQRAQLCCEAADVYLLTWKAEMVTGSRRAAMKSFHSGASAVRTY